MIGKTAQAEVRLGIRDDDKEYERLYKRRSGVLLEDAGTLGGVAVNGERYSRRY
ncbi:hypothetical protein [Acidovorax sp. Leaf160]|uniref:hypothetical protein n=1 Tax=Acidovorax sp. Leaf160 TaxID=1736280 RepID=UPI000B3110BA|nr:hypothetical protein [Acidovorax sp. Leaf160]